MSYKTDLAISLFNSGFNCAQSVLAVFCEEYDVEEETALKMSSGFGAGVRSGEICGAVSGAVLVIGLKYGQSEGNDKASKENCNNKTVEFLDLFRKKNGSVVCRDLLGYDLSIDEEYAEAFSKDLFKTVCVDMVVSAVSLLEELDY